eukprot:9124086-Pyramimonas_sp.AAC.1
MHRLQLDLNSAPQRSHPVVMIGPHTDLLRGRRGEFRSTCPCRLHDPLVRGHRPPHCCGPRRRGPRPGLALGPRSDLLGGQ